VDLHLHSRLHLHVVYKRKVYVYNSGAVCLCRTTRCHMPLLSRCCFTTTLGLCVYLTLCVQWDAGLTHCSNVGVTKFRLQEPEDQQPTSHRLVFHRRISSAEIRCTQSVSWNGVRQGKNLKARIMFMLLIAVDSLCIRVTLTVM